MKNSKFKITNPPSSPFVKGGKRGIFLCALLLALCISPHLAIAAVGDAVVANSSVSASSTLDIQPGSGVEWLVHNIQHEDDVEIQWYDGTNVIASQRFLGAGKEPMGVRVTNSIRLRVKNLNTGSSKRIGYDGVVTK